MKIIEWFFNIFLRKKAKILKQETIFERQKAILEYNKAKEKNDKYLDRYSGKRKYRKV